MAWYALYNWFIPWRKIPYTNWVRFYKRYLYEEWFNSLPKDKQKEELERQQQIKEQRKREGAMALARFKSLYRSIDDIAQESMHEYIGTARFYKYLAELFDTVD